MIEKIPSPKPTLAEILADSDFTDAEQFTDRALLDAPAVGGELI